MIQILTKDFQYINVQSQIIYVSISNYLYTFSINKNNVALSQYSGTDTVVATLSSKPTDDVVINVVSENTNYVTVDPKQLIYKPSDNSLSKNVTIQGIENDSKVNITVSTDFKINQELTKDQNFNNDNKQTLGVLLYNYNFIINNKSILLTNYNQTKTFSVILDNIVNDVVVLDITNSNTSYINANKTSLIFNAVNWNTPQSVDLSLNYNDQIPITSSDILISVNQSLTKDEYYLPVPSQKVEITIDLQDYVVNPKNVEVSSSGSTEKIYITLSSKPSGNVSFDIIESNTKAVELSTKYSKF